MSDTPLAENIAQQLRRDILLGRLAPGASIKERDNATELGVSRTPMREAIRILAKEGLVVLRPSRSPIVASPDFTEIRGQSEVLIALEALAVGLACDAASEQDLDQISVLLAQMEREFSRIDALDMFEIDMEFHSTIAKASHNQPLVETHRSFLQRLWRSRFLAARQQHNRETLVEEHRAIVAAMLARDATAARAAMDHHLHNMAEDIRLVLD